MNILKESGNFTHKKFRHIFIFTFFYDLNFKEFYLIFLCDLFPLIVIKLHISKKKIIKNIEKNTGRLFLTTGSQGNSLVRKSGNHDFLKLTLYCMNFFSEASYTEMTPRVVLNDIKFDENFRQYFTYA